MTVSKTQKTEKHAPRRKMHEAKGERKKKTRIGRIDNSPQNPAFLEKA